MLTIEGLLTDPKKEREGIWYHFRGGVELRIARWMNPAHRDAVMAHHEATKDRPPSEEEAHRAWVRAVAEHVIMDWRGVADRDGKETPYTPELGFSILTQENGDVLFQFVRERSQRIEAYMAGVDKALLGNSSPDSNGSSSSGTSKTSSPTG